jgi:hypothetical protein
MRRGQWQRQWQQQPVATVMAAAIDALRETALVNLVVVAVTKTVATSAEARALVAAMAVLRATALAMRAVTARAIEMVMAVVRLVTRRRLRSWIWGNKVNIDNNNNNLTTT